MEKTNLISLLSLCLCLSLFGLTACGESEDDSVPETCADGIQNQDETDIDCGGVCAPCATCSDGIMNQGETGIDCGGPCDPCFSEFMTAKIDGVDFAANLVAGNVSGDLLKFQSDQSQERQMFFEVPKDVTLGTYDFVADANFMARYAKLFEGEYETEAGTIEITLHDTDANKLAGTFQFTTVQYDFGTPVDTVVISEGAFGVEYFE